MLDVHPPHQAVHSWRDFFIHIATIVLGLLIAIGLEQTVEYFHGRHELRETVKALKDEREHNIRLFHINVTRQREAVALLENNLRVFDYLQQHPGAAMDALPGVPVWNLSSVPPVTDAWTSAVQSNIVARMPAEEVAADHELYAGFDRFLTQDHELWLQLNTTNEYQYTQPDLSKLKPEEIARVVDGLRACLRLEFLTLLSLENISRNAADFKPGPTEAEMDGLQHLVSTADAKRLYPHAYEFTRHDVDQALAFDKAHGK